MKKLFFILVALATFATACQLGGVSGGEPTPIPLNATTVARPTEFINPTAAPQGGGAPEAGTTRASSADGMTQVYVPAGTFMRGGVDTNAHNNETPAVKITMEIGRASCRERV